MKNAFYLLIFTCFLFSCKNEPAANAEDKGTMVETPSTSKKYKISDFSESPAFSDAKIESMKYTSGKFAFGVANYELGAQTPDAPQKMCANSGKGQHIHLIIDNAPYAAKYTSEFEHDVADGEHYLLAFLSRSYHESIKTSAAHTAMKIQVANKSISDVEAIKEPMLFYSRPKGTYIGKSDTEKIMLDFYPVNAKIGAANYKVQVDINGEQTEVLDSWAPRFVEGLPMGENTIKLTLLNNDGSVADVPLNPVSRTFTLKEDPAPGQ